ncbi:MAG: Na(+)-translocating NADH-quinone reductase subunit C [Alcanivorax sp.]|nr:Na(+)-translocating NADH-quinone reductase subunit C [Alcanivorax sp.]
MAGKNESVSKTLLVAFLVCVVCGVVVATAAVSLRPVQEANKLKDKRKNILQAAGLYHQGVKIDDQFKSIKRKFVDIKTGDYVDTFPGSDKNIPDSYDQRKAAKDPSESFRVPDDQDIAKIKTQAQVAEVYLAYDDQGKLSRIILPVHGYGLWSTMYGFLALQPDANTVAGFGFYEQGETPGLGGEVDNPKWKALWPGKKLFDDNGKIAIDVVKHGTGSPAKADYTVDGLAGATLTTKGVDHLVRYWVSEDGFGPYLKHMRAAEGSNASANAKTDAATTDKGEA